MKTILVIEDTLTMRENIAEILALAPYDVVQAANGKQGIELARQTRPDLILCDIMMPELDGFGVLHILASDPELADVPFIFLTAKAEPADFRAGMNLGADDYLAKPFDDLTLLNMVALRLRKGGRRQPDLTPPANLDKLMRAILGEMDAHLTLCEHYPTTQFIRKHRLYTTGSWPTALYCISQGKVKLFRTDTTGNEFITALLGPGDFVGHLALLDEMPYGETAELLDDAHVCLIPKADFLALIDHNKAVSSQFIRLLAGNVADQQERMLKLAYQPVRKRVVEALLMFQRKFYPASGDPATANTSPPMTLSRENWAHLVGASTETVIRILSDLRAEGLIDLTASQITLLNIYKLTQIKR